MTRYGTPVATVRWQPTTDHPVDSPAPIIRRTRRHTVSGRGVAAVIAAMLATVTAAGGIAYQAGVAHGAQSAAAQANRAADRRVDGVTAQAQSRLDACVTAVRAVADSWDTLGRVADTITAADQSGSRVLFLDPTLTGLAADVAAARADTHDAATACK